MHAPSRIPEEHPDVAQTWRDSGLGCGGREAILFRKGKYQHLLYIQSLRERVTTGITSNHIPKDQSDVSEPLRGDK